MFPSTDEKNYLVDKLPGITFESLSESYLRAEVVAAATNSYAFKMQVSDVGNQPKSAQLLKQNDLFIVTHASLVLKLVATASIASDAAQGAAKLYNYPNPSIFSTGTQAANLEAVYNGFLSFEVDRVKRIPALDTRNFLRIPDTQAGAIQAAIAGPVTYANPRDGMPSGLYGYYPTDIFQFDGQQTLDFNLLLAGAIDLTGTSVTTYIVLMLKGYLAQDMAKKQDARTYI